MLDRSPTQFTELRSPFPGLDKIPSMQPAEIQALPLRRRSRVLAELRMLQEIHERRMREHQQGIASAVCRASVCSRIFPWLRPLALAGQSCEWQPHRPAIMATLAQRKQAHKRWVFLMLCLRMAGKLFLVRARRRGADRIKSFVKLLIVNNKLVMGLRHSMTVLRRIQRSIRAWLVKLSTKRMLVDLLFQQTEVDLIMKRTFSECTKILKQENKKLRTMRGKKERHLAERGILIARTRYESFKNPKTALDYKFLNDHIEQCRMPRSMLTLAVEHAVSCRKTLLKREMSLRATESEKFRRDMETWTDIQVALQLLNPEAQNPAVKPESPVERPLHFLVNKEKVLQIVRRLRQWYEENRAALRGDDGKVTGELTTEQAGAVGNIVCTLMLTNLDPI